jgi:MFS family permease
MVLFTMGEMVLMPMSSAYLANLAPAHMRGRYMGVSGLTWGLALIIGPAAGMKLFTVEPAAYWLACAALGVFAAAIISLRTDARVAPPAVPQSI